MDQTNYEVTSPIRFGGKEYGMGTIVSMTSEQAKEFAPCLADPAARKKGVLLVDDSSTQRIAALLLANELLEKDCKLFEDEVDISHRTIERQSQQLNQLGLELDALKDKLAQQAQLEQPGAPGESDKPDQSEKPDLVDGNPATPAAPAAPAVIAASAATAKDSTKK